MKKMTKILTAVLAVAVFLTTSVGSFAAETSDAYKVTISAGNHGTIDGADKISVDKNKDTWFKPSDVTLKPEIAIDENGNEVESPSKYYVKGIRISGRDDAQVIATLSGQNAPDDRDVDYVVVYGIKGNQVSYTVEYVDANGKKLAEPDTFYGNIGDKPVVACKYISGYAPQAFALTGTLGETPEENVFKFIYTPSAINYFNKVTEVVDGETYVTYVDGPSIVVSGGTTGAGFTGGASNVTGGGAGVGAEDGETAGGAEGGAGEELPPEIIDLDDEETPLANIDADSDSKMALPLAGYVAMGVIGLAALIAIIIMILKNKAKKEMNKE